MNTYKTEKTAKNALEKLLNDNPKMNFKLHQTDKGEFFIKPTQTPRNILRKSKIESPCGHVWAVAPKLYEKGLKRGQIIDQLIDDGIAYHTAKTQYQLWYSAYKLQNQK